MFVFVAFRSTENVNNVKLNLVMSTASRCDKERHMVKHHVTIHSGEGLSIITSESSLLGWVPSSMNFNEALHCFIGSTIHVKTKLTLMASIN